jgi:hypothetical protein
MDGAAHLERAAHLDDGGVLLGTGVGLAVRVGGVGAVDRDQMRDLRLGERRDDAGQPGRPLVKTSSRFR